jgi:hypothetical protein
MAISLGSVSSAMHGAVVPIAYFTGNGSSSASFTNIPQIYQDLQIIIFGRSNFSSTFAGYSLYFNNQQNNTSYSQTYLSGDGSNATSGRNNGYGFSGAIPATNATSGVFASYTFNVLNYTNSTTLKTALFRAAQDSNGSGNTSLNVGLYRTNTNAITQIDFVCQGALVSGSSVALYGIRTIGQ